MNAEHPHLRAVPASGEPVKRAVGRTDDGTPVWSMVRTACPGCEMAATRHQEITYYLRAWWHIECARLDLASRPKSKAWIALAEQLVKAPSNFKPREVRAITQALLDIAEPGAPMEAIS